MRWSRAIVRVGLGFTPSCEAAVYALLCLHVHHWTLNNGHRAIDAAGLAWNQTTLMNEDKSVAVRPSLPPISVNIEQLLDKAVDAKSGVEVLQALQQMRREMKAEQAKEEFDRAFAAFQSECPPIVKGKGVSIDGKTAYKYAPFEDIIATIKPFLQKHGFSYTLDTDVASADRWVIAKCKINHAGGHSTESVAKFPLGSGNRLMSDTQVYAAALTFATRRVLCNAFGLVVAGEDSDGRVKSMVKPQGPSTIAPADAGTKLLVKTIWDICKPINKDKNSWNSINQWLWSNDILDGAIPEEMPNLSPERLGQVIEKAKKLIPQ